MWLHKIAKRGESRIIGGGCDEEAVADHRETEPFLLFFPPPFLILIKGPLQDKQCLPTLQFKQRGPLRPKRWFLNVHWQVGLICVLSRWRWTYIYLFYFPCIPLSCYFSTSVKLYGTLRHKSTLVLHRSCSLVYTRHAVLKVRTGPAAEAWAETSSGFFIPKTSWPWLRTSRPLHTWNDNCKDN